MVGDGDLSNGATMAEIINNARPDVKIVASVLESEVMHNTGKICIGTNLLRKGCFCQWRLKIQKCFPLWYQCTRIQCETLT